MNSRNCSCRLGGNIEKSRFVQCRMRSRIQHVASENQNFLHLDCWWIISLLKNREKTIFLSGILWIKRTQHLHEYEKKICCFFSPSSTWITLSLLGNTHYVRFKQVMFPRANRWEKSSSLSGSKYWVERSMVHRANLLGKNVAC